MEASTEYPGVRTGEGYAVAHLEDLGDGPGFRKVRKGLGVTAFGVNAIVLPPGIETGFHYHDLRSSTSCTEARSRWSSAMAPCSALARAAWRVSTQRPCARSATRATSTLYTCAREARMATSDAMDVCALARRSV
jgi:hypothetical protein